MGLAHCKVKVLGGRNCGCELSVSVAETSDYSYLRCPKHGVVKRPSNEVTAEMERDDKRRRRNGTGAAAAADEEE